jgi:NAD+ kinase
MRIHIFGRNKDKIEELKKNLDSFPLEYSEEHPELVVCYGGDGTFLIAERVFPGIPKIFIKGSEISAKGEDIDISDAIKKYLEGNFKIEEIKKLRATHKGIFEIRELLGVNDLVIRNTLPTEAIRFKLKTENEETKEFVGDGVVISSPFGSGGYFCSIVKEEFEKGIGLALNNVRGEEKVRYLEENSKIEIELTRGPGVLVADNNRDYINLETGDKIVIEQTEEIARRVILEIK